MVSLSPSCRVFSYLDDVMVVVPASFAETALNAVVTELEGVGLTVNAPTFHFVIVPGVVMASAAS